MSFKDRLNSLRLHLNLSGNGLAKALGKSPGQVNGILRGANYPGYMFLAALAETVPHLNLHWLITGKGNTWLEGSEEEEPKLYTKEVFKEAHTEKSYKQLYEDCKSHGQTKDELIKSLQQQVQMLMDTK